MIVYLQKMMSVLIGVSAMRPTMFSIQTMNGFLNGMSKPNDRV